MPLLTPASTTPFGREVHRRLRRALGRPVPVAAKQGPSEVRPKEREHEDEDSHDDIPIDVLPVVEEVPVYQLIRNDHHDGDRNPDAPVSKKMPPHRDPLDRVMSTLAAAV